MPPPMSKRLPPLALLLGLVAAACSTPTQATVGFGSGTRFVPEVADSMNDAGLYPSVVTTDDGQPYVAYFSFPDVLPKGSVAPPRPIGSPSIPGVMLATVKDGIWIRGAIAIAASIPNVDVAFGPAIDASVGNLTHDNVTGLQLVIDSQGGLHAAWGSSAGLFYASGTGDPSGAPWTMEQVAVTPPIGLSLAVDASGTPWIASYSGSGPALADVTLSTLSGDRWTSDSVSSADVCANCRTTVLVGSEAPAVVFGGGSHVWIATNDGKNGWESQDLGAGGAGLSGTVDSDGTTWLLFYDGTEVKVLTGPFPGSHASTVATVGADPATSDGARTSIAVDDSGTASVAWYDPGTDAVGLATGKGDAFTPIDVGDTQGGTFPSVAVTPDGSLADLAWYAKVSGPQSGGVVPGADLLLGTYGDVQGLGLAVQSPTPTGGAPTTSPTPSTTCEQADKTDTVQIVAKGLAFTPETSCIQVPASKPFTIHFDNQDAGTPHDVAIFPSATELTTVLFRPPGYLTGVASTDYHVDALDAGTYFFHCDVHPTMTGSVVSK
jgi:plastocyanin